MLLIQLILCSLISSAFCSLRIDSSQKGGLKPHQKDALLGEHNRIRSEVARGRVRYIYFEQKFQKTPTAAYMRQLVWDDGIAAGAQAYADKCQIYHGPSSGYGESIVAHGNLIRLPVHLFSAEVRRTENKNTLIRKYKDLQKEGPKKQYGHYAAMVWARTQKMGCGFKICDPRVDRHFGGWRGKGGLLVCRYHPGAVEDMPVYEIGPTCSKCPGNCVEGLCLGKHGASGRTSYKQGNVGSNRQTKFQTNNYKPKQSGVQTTWSCRDKGSRCERNAKKGYCSDGGRTGKYMAKNCKKSCDLC